MDKENLIEALEGIKSQVEEKTKDFVTSEAIAEKADKSEIETKASKEEVEGLKAELEAIQAKFDSIPAIVSNKNKNEEKMNISEVFKKSVEETGAAKAEISYKALNQGRNVSGGAVDTYGITTSLIDVSPLRGLATVLPTTGSVVNLPILGGGSDFDTVGATRGTATASTDNTNTVTQLVIETLEKLAHVSAETVEDIPSFDAVYAEHLLMLAGQTEAKKHVAVLEGATAVEADAAATVSLADLDALYSSVGVAYRANGAFMLSSGAMSALRLLEDTAGSLVWNPAIGTFTLWGKPVYENPYMAAVGADAVVGAFGDFKKGFAIADKSTFELGRYTQTSPGNVSYYAKLRTKGGLWDTSAVKVLQMASA